MSSDEEFFEPTPEVVVPRQTGRRKAKDPSPKKVPKKKQREVLGNFNVELDDDQDDSDDDGDEDFYDSEGESSKSRKGRSSVSAAASSRGKSKQSGHAGGLESVESNSGSSGGGASANGHRVEVENVPPARRSAAVNLSDDEDSQRNSGESSRQRSRKRLSIRTTDGESRRSSVGPGSVVSIESLATPTEVQNIYQTCSQMFNTNRIKPENAFNLRLLDCINQMINSPNYDKTNMQLTSSTVEIGTKIYVCRVENTHAQVMNLASEVSRQQRRQTKNDGAGGEGQDGENQEQGNADDFHSDNEEEGRGRRQKQKKRTARKRGRFVEEDNSKLLTGLEEQNVKFTTRRNFLQKKFNEMTSDDLDFDYLSYFLEDDDVHPLQTEEEKKNLKSPLVIADGYLNAPDMSRLDFLPFFHLPKFDPETHDLWGRPLNAAETFRDDDAFGLNGSQLQVNPEFAYNPADRPAEYPEEPDPNNMMHDFDDDLPADLDMAEGGGPVDLPPVNFHDIRSLDHLDEYFQRVKSLLKDTKSKFGWCGPNFVKPKSMWPSNSARAKKAKVRKEPQRIDFENIDWSDKMNKYTVQNQSARTVFDDKVIESWSTQKVVIPFLGIELTSYDDDFDPLDFENENDAKYVPPIFKMFSNRNYSILDLLKAKKGRGRHPSSEAAPSIGGDMDDGFDGDEIEVPREIAEDFCSQPLQEDGPYGSTPAETEAGWQFPSSLPGLLADNEPLSLVSDIDSIRFSRKPKPIDMSILKKAIFKTLVEKLDLDEHGIPKRGEATNIDLADLMYLVLRKIGEKTEKLMSVPIFIVALMHVVADKRLFVEYDESDPDCPVVVCKGKSFNHADHIPMPLDNFY